MEVLTHKFYEAQKRLLKHYIVIEPLPEYPVDLSAKINQKLMRDFFFRTIEELVEAYDEVCNTLNKESDNNSVEASQAGANLLLELADVHHFIMEILIYSGLEPEMLHLAFKNLQGENIPPTTQNWDVFQDIYQNSMEAVNKYWAEAEYSLYQCFSTGIPESTGLPIYRIRLNYYRVLSIQVEMWELVQALMSAANCLKSKAWVQGQRESNLVLYQERIVKATMVWFNILYMVTQAPLEDLYKLYIIKNDINYARIQQKY